MVSSPADVANLALDALGVPNSISDLEEGGKEAEVLLRHYGPTRRRLLKAAHWNFARKQVYLDMLGDATGQTTAWAAASGNATTVITTVQPPWSYAYALPADCLKARFVPWQALQPGAIPVGNIQVSTFSAGNQTPAHHCMLRPARFLVATDSNYPLQGGQDLAYGLAPASRICVFTDVRHAQLIYTADVLYPSLWDSMFLDAFAALLAAEVAMAVVPDRKLAQSLRNQQLGIAKEKITEARISDGNEGWSSVNRDASWISARWTGPMAGDWGGRHDGPGMFGGGWDNYGGIAGSAF